MEKKTKILVVEDEIRQQEWLTRSLSNAGHESPVRAVPYWV